MPPLSPRLLRLEVVRGLPCPLFVVGTSHELWLVSQPARIISRAPIDAARGYSNFQSSMRRPVVVSTPHMISQPALIRKGVFKFFFNFFSAAKWRRLDMQPIYIAHIGIMIRAYRIVFPYCQVRVRGYFFLSEKFYTIPHTTHVPRASSLHSTKILRYAIRAQYNSRGRECHTSRLICGQNSILGGLEARRARSLYLGE